MTEPDRPQLRAVPVPAEEIPPGDRGPVYADITGEERRPVLPYWAASREAFTVAARRVLGREWHRARYHGLRSPVYLVLTAFWGVAGGAWLAAEWLRWWLFPVPYDVHADAVRDGWRAWRAVATDHRRIAKSRAIISLTVGFGLAFAVRLLLLQAYAREALAAAGLAAVLAGARYGRPDGARIVTAAHIPAEYEPLTQDVVTRALGALGITKIDQWLNSDRKIEYIGPVRQDGPGWRAEANLPYGVEAIDVIERRGRLASGLRRPLGAVWPEPVTEEHPGRLELWVGQQDITTRKPVPWPLLRSGTVDVFKPVPVGTDTRARGVKGPLVYHNWLIGSMPRNGKTATVRELNCAIALDALCEQQVHELKGTGDLDAFEALCTRFVSGIDDDSVAYTAESLRKLRAECGRRSPKIKALPTSICPEKRVTRQIAERYRDLRPLVCTIDECQNLFAHPKFGKQAGIDAEFIIKVGPAMGIVLILATQRPDKASLPTGISANVSIRFCLYVAGQLENDMILGTSAYRNGIRATLFRPETDAGLGWLKGATAVPKVMRSHFLDVPATQSVVVRARALRERAGTLPAAAGPEGERDVLADVLAVIGADPGVHWDVLAERLAQRWPDRWAGITGDAISAQCRAFGVRSVGVKMAGRNLQGCRREAVEQLAAVPYLAGQS